VVGRQPAFIPTYKTVSASQSPGCKLYPEVIMNGGVPGASITFEPGLWSRARRSCPRRSCPRCRVRARVRRAGAGAGEPTVCSEGRDCAGSAWPGTPATLLCAAAAPSRTPALTPCA